MEMYIRFNAQLLNTLETKVLFTITYLKGTVFNWFEPHLTDYLENQLKDRKIKIIRLFTNWTNFKDELKKVYRGVNKERIAKREI